MLDILLSKGMLVTKKASLVELAFWKLMIAQNKTVGNEVFEFLGSKNLRGDSQQSLPEFILDSTTSR